MSDNTTQSYAYQGAQDAGSNLTDINALMFLINQVISGVNTSMPVKVMKAPYDKDGTALEPGSPAPIGYIDVLPMVNQLDGYGKAVKHKTVYRLSYHRYQGGNGAFISDPVEGDIGLMACASRDTSGVRQTNDQANPGSLRRFDMADGTYLGCTQAKEASTQWFSWTPDGFKLQDKHGNILIGGAEGIRVNGILFARGGEGTFREHTHAQPSDSDGDAEMETAHPTPGT